MHTRIFYSCICAGMKIRVFIFMLCCARSLSGQQDSLPAQKTPELYFGSLEYCGYSDRIQYAVDQNFTYPEAAIRAGKEGVVIFSILFNWKGEVSEPEIIFDPGVGCSPEWLLKIPFFQSWSSFNLEQEKKTIRVVRYLHYRLSDTSITYCTVHPDFDGPFGTPWQWAQANKVYEPFDLAKTASYPGGEWELSKFLTKELGVFSCNRDSMPFSTRAAVEFVVNKDGSLQNIKILKSAHPCTDEAILTAFRRMPRWSPGEANGCPVRMRYVVPVRIHWE